jgi:hypothetical protein
MYAGCNGTGNDVFCIGIVLVTEAVVLKVMEISLLTKMILKRITYAILHGNNY